jgi:hypothetical protein
MTNIDTTNFSNGITVKNIYTEKIRGSNSTQLNIESATGVINCNSSKLSNVLDPTLQQDVSTKAYTDAHITNTNNPHSVTKTQIGLGNVENIKNNLSAIINPTASDDSSLGYSIGSVWINTATYSIYTCTRSTVSSAIWNTAESSIEQYSAESATQINTNSTIYVPTGLTFTPTAGTYLVFANTTCKGSAHGDIYGIAISKNFTAISGSQRNSSDLQLNNSTQYIVTVNGSESIDLVYKIIYGTGNYQLGERNLIALKIS